MTRRTRNTSTPGAATVGWCIAALTVIAAAASGLGASPFAVLLFVLLQGALVLLLVLRPQTEGPWVLGTVVFGLLLVVFLALVLSVHVADEREHVERLGWRGVPQGASDDAP